MWSLASGQVTQARKRGRFYARYTSTQEQTDGKLPHSTGHHSRPFLPSGDHGGVPPSSLFLPSLFSHDRSDRTGSELRYAAAAAPGGQRGRI